VALYVTNTLTRRKELFQPWNPPDVKMYVCGVNLHGPAHVGHARSYVFFDVVRRHLEWSGSVSYTHLTLPTTPYV
jgi:cysteinyl-tRNA synthetase